jgi:hypothetical protein
VYKNIEKPKKEGDGAEKEVTDAAEDASAAAETETAE